MHIVCVTFFSKYFSQILRIYLMWWAMKGDTCFSYQYHWTVALWQITKMPYSLCDVDIFKVLLFQHSIYIQLISQWIVSRTLAPLPDIPMVVDCTWDTGSRKAPRTNMWQHIGCILRHDPPWTAIWLYIPGPGWGAAVIHILQDHLHDHALVVVFEWGIEYGLKVLVHFICVFACCVDLIVYKRAGNTTRFSIAYSPEVACHGLTDDNLRPIISNCHYFNIWNDIIMDIFWNETHLKHLRNMANHLIAPAALVVMTSY